LVAGTIADVEEQIPGQMDIDECIDVAETGSDGHESVNVGTLHRRAGDTAGAVREASAVHRAGLPELRRI